MRLIPSLIDQDLRLELEARYQEPNRHYHGMGHVQALLGLLDRHRESTDDTDAVEAAIWFHDAIYDSRRGDNEARSADLAGRCLAGKAEPQRLQRIAAMIEATGTHELPEQDW